jgi:hypothetical protein
MRRCRTASARCPWASVSPTVIGAYVHNYPSRATSSSLGTRDAARAGRQAGEPPLLSLGTDRLRAGGACGDDNRLSRVGRASATIPGGDGMHARTRTAEPRARACATRTAFR